MKTIVIILILFCNLCYGQIQNPPYISCDNDVVRTLTVENHDILIFHPEGRILLLQPLSELHIWDKLIVNDVPDALITFGGLDYGYLDNDSISRPKLIFHNCDDYYQTNSNAVMHFSTKIEIIFDCETLSVPTQNPEIKDFYTFDSIIYNILGQVLYKGKLGSIFHNDRIYDEFRFHNANIIFIKVFLYDGSTLVFKKIYK